MPRNNAEYGSRYNTEYEDQRTKTTTGTWT